MILQTIFRIDFIIFRIRCVVRTPSAMHRGGGQVISITIVEMVSEKSIFVFAVIKHSGREDSMRLWVEFINNT